jgi:hypothetical protein
MNKLKMGKPAAILLIVALELGILFAGQQANTIDKPGPVSLGILAPLSISGSLYSTTHDTNRLPTVWDVTLFDFLYGYTAQVYWARPGHNQKQIAAIARHGHGARLAGTRSQDSLPSGGQPPAVAAASLSLYSLSPPGLILRL